MNLEDCLWGRMYQAIYQGPRRHDYICIIKKKKKKTCKEFLPNLVSERFANKKKVLQKYTQETKSSVVSTQLPLPADAALAAFLRQPLVFYFHKYTNSS